MGDSYPALDWTDLGQSIQSELASKGLGDTWFSSTGKDPDMRRTVLNLYVKMTGTKLGSKRLWDFVGRQFATKLGALEFTCIPQAEDFMKALEASPMFTNPGSKTDDWDSRELVASLQLHFKHFKGWEKNRVEVHIDPQGLYSGPGIGRINVFQMIAHGTSQEDYKKVAMIQEQLIDKGWGKTILNK